MTQARVPREGPGAAGWLTATLVLAAVMFSVLPLPALASESGGAANADEPPLQVVSEVFRGPFPERGLHKSAAFWISQQLQHGYFLEGGHANGFPRLAATDLESNATLGPVRLDPPGYFDSFNGSQVSGPGQPHVIAVDEAHGRLFVAYQAADLISSEQLINGGAVRSGTAGRVCIRVFLKCFGGIHVVDAATLEVKQTIPVRVVNVDGTTVAPVLHAMAYSPSRSADDTAKLHILLGEWAAEVQFLGNETNPRRRLPALTYLIQIDAATGTQDWTARVDACRGTRNPPMSGGTDSAMYHRGGAAAVYRSMSLTRPEMVVACYTASAARTAAVVRIPLDERSNPYDLPVATGHPTDLAGSAAGQAGGPQPVTPGQVAFVAPGQTITFGPDRVVEMHPDPPSGRVLFRVVDGAPAAEVWWVYDTEHSQFIGTIGIGPAQLDINDAILSAATIDTVRGRLYALAPPHRQFSGGLLIADIRRTPIPQALLFPEFAHLAQKSQSVSAKPLVVLTPQEPGDPARIYAPIGSLTDPTDYWMILDRLPTSAESSDSAPRSLDLEERPGATAASLDGAARGYGARALLVGGLEAMQRLGPVDTWSSISQVRDTEQQPQHRVWRLPPKDISQQPCWEANREVLLGAVGPQGPVIVDHSGSRGAVQPVLVDSTLSADMEAPASRCSGEDWEAVWAKALFGSAPVAEPSFSQLADMQPIDCTSEEDVPERRVGDPVVSPSSAGVRCGQEEASGFSYVRGVGTVEGLRVAEALSSFRIYRDPGRGIVSRVESVARGIAIAGVVRIESVRGMAESWANGRRQPLDGQAREPEYVANCDLERTAGTCFSGAVFGLWTPSYHCSPCGDEARIVDAISRALGANAQARLRQPDPELARGSADGFNAAVQKPEHERFADLALSNDLLQTVVPTLEVMRPAPPNRTLFEGGSRGRQIYQFAGVEVSSSYSIQCLLVYDKESNTCDTPVEKPGSLTLKLNDTDGQPLDGGAFEVRMDVDEDGIAGLADQLLPQGACITARDGVGTCRFDGLAPGGYLVSQLAAPSGYLAHAEPVAVELAADEDRTVTFSNVPNMAAIEISAEHHDGRPLPGATFVTFADPDGNGNVSTASAPVASCTTDQTGTCRMRVPTGSYVLTQTTTPNGLEPMEPLAFTLTQGGQTALVRIVNSAGEAARTRSAEPLIDYIDPPATDPAFSAAAPARPGRTPAGIAEPPATAESRAGVGGTITSFIRAPGDALRLFARSPVEATAWLTSMGMLGLAALAIRRRGTLTMLDGAIVAPRMRAHVPVHKPAPRRGTPKARQPSNEVQSPPPAAGGSQTVGDNVHARVVAATADPGLVRNIAARLDGDARCTLVSILNALGQLDSVLQHQRPDVLVIDVGLLTAAPNQGWKDLPRHHPPMRTIALVPAHPSPKAVALNAYEIGIAGILATQDLSNGVLAYAVRSVADGKPFYGPTIHALLADRWQRGRRGVHGPAGLSLRELEIARMTAAGATRRQIADTLCLSPWTVKRHLVEIREKLGIADTPDRRHLHEALRVVGALEEDTPAQ